MDIEVYEIFKSIQGEGCLQGVPSVLIRLVGCNLNCCWCDTKHFFHSGKSFSISEDMLLSTLSSYQCKNIIITGGEPLINPQISQIVKLLKYTGYHITIETNATTINYVDCDLISMSPKLSHSIPHHLTNETIIAKHDRLRINIEAINFYIQNYDYQIKFVIRDKKEDIDEINDLLKQIGHYDPFKVFVMPLAATRSDLYKVQKNLVKLCIDHGLRYANRLQLQIWGGRSKEA